eukprot:CAMPEP_0179102750 /NCGR_PEP_ID=MMETSP0796-20121207/47572_1 /TAXON_ID=73915 /ORGANISM="Pyrodinium bahamense, Strain pbaha01" /LENGTH=349 /DNA_ID=CAMNT_0020800633 /DNA_START=76 /DNA_END=1125 /DNA_ORIENTATION=-
MKRSSHVTHLVSNLVRVATIFAPRPAWTARTFLAEGSTQLASNDSRSLAEPAPAQSSDARHLVYTADLAVFPALLRSMQSVALHTAAPESYVIHMIVPEADAHRASSLAACFSQRLRQESPGHVPQVLVHKELPMPFKVGYQDRQDLRGHSSAFARLFVADYLPNATRAVYLDTDTLVMGDLAPLFGLKLGSALAAVEEGTSFQQLWGKWNSGLARLVPNQSWTIFNDGVLVLDLLRWRADNITGDLAAWAAQAGASMDDQLLLNLEFQQTRGFDRLSSEWNYYRVRPTGWPKFGWSGELPPEHELCRARILHWTGPKPWALQHRGQWIEQYRHLWELPGAGKGDMCGV